VVGYEIDVDIAVIDDQLAVTHNEPSATSAIPDGAHSR
jgi:hypothetical protein